MSDEECQKVSVTVMRCHVGSGTPAADIQEVIDHTGVAL